MEIYAMREFDGHELVVFGHNAVECTATIA